MEGKLLLSDFRKQLCLLFFVLILYGFSFAQSNLVAALPLNEGTGTAAADVSGASHPGVLTNGPTWGAGKYGQGVNLDGTNDYINIADHADFTLDPAQSYTWSGWIKNNNFTEWSTVWSQTLNASNFFYFYAHTSTDPDGGPVTNGLSVYWWNGGGTNKIGVHSSNNVLTVGQWSHVAVTYDASQVQNNRFTIYVNGIDVTVRTDVSSTGTIASINPANTRIGSNQPFGEYLNGSVDEVRFYRRLLSVTEVQTDMNTPLAPDVTPPAVSLTAPAAGTVSGTINVTANASDNLGVAGVQFLLNGANLGTEDVASPYSVSWNTTTATNGTYTLTARVRDAAGNTTTSASVVVTVNNAPDTQVPTVSITAPAAGNVTGTINVTANASDNIGVTGVQFLLNGVNLGAEDVASPYSVSWNTLTATNGTYTLTARARDAAGNTSTSAGVIVTVNNDIQAPVVSITAPAAGTVTGTINVTANASDNVGVAGVQFLLNGANLGAEDVASPYSVSWNTTTATNGTYTLTARARDAAGNTTTSASVVVTINNAADTQAPTVGITAPAAGTVTGTINVTANATDNIGVSGVQFLLNGVNLGTEDVASPYSVSWNTTTSANGTYTLTARARDAAGNTTTSAGVVVTVSNTTLLTALPLNEGTGTAAADISGYSHPGTLINAPTWGAGKYGQGVNLDGTNDYINIADHADFTLDPTQNYSWSGWVKNTNFTEWSTVWSQTVDANNFFYFYAHTTTDADGGPVTNGLSVYWWNGGGTNKIGAHSSNNVLTAGQWSYVAVTYDASQLQNNRFSIYVNGVDVTVRTDVSSTGTIASINPTNIRIGSNQPFGEYLNGSVDEVRFYKKLLSLAEVQADMNTPMAIAPDVTAPAVSITAPATGTVLGTINVTANASDNVGVAGVQFLLNGVNLGAEDIASPYSVSWNTATSANGTYTLTARARDAAGNTATSTGVVVTVNNDIQAPVVNLTEPAAGTVLGTINVSASASDNIGVSGVQFLLNGANLGTEDVAAPYSISWNTTTAANGTYTLTARARDAAGNTTTSAGVAVTVNNDTQAPTINLTEPVAGIVLATINVSANAADNIGVSGVQFLLDGANLGAEDIAAPYTISWNTTTIADGNHTLTARARDAAGNTTTSVAVVVTVQNNPPDTQVPAVNITAPAAGNVSGTLNVTANATDNVGVAGVQFLLNGVNLGAEDVAAPYSISWNTTTATNGTYTLTARARDAASNTATSASVVVTVNNDIQAPTVSITAPAAGTVLGTINVSANAADNVGVSGVQFLLDGNNLGSEDVAAPYTISWNTTTVTDGNHTLTARARDAAGNITTSAAVVVTVNNDTQAPAVSITAPAAGNVTGTISITATASDNVGVAGVQFLLNGANLGAEDVVSPYSVSWNTQSVANGTYILTARARDASGNTATSSPVSVTVSNSSTLIVALNLNDGTGTAAADISGNNHPGTLVNSPTWGAGKYGQGLTFNGTTNYVNIPDHSDFDLDPTQSYTWSTWVKNTNFNEWMTVWSQTVDANNFFYFYAHTSTDADGGPVTNGISAYWWGNGGTNKVGVHSSNNVLTAGQWSYVAITYDASQLQNNRFTIYVNGVDVTVRTDVSSTGTLTSINPTNIRVGSNQPFGEYLNGSVDEVRFYKRLLSAAEVVTDMNSPLPNTIIPSGTPANGATGISITTTVTAVFNVVMDAATINSSTVELRDASNALVAATISYNSTTRTVTLTPLAALAYASVYTAKIKGGVSGVKDAIGSTMASDYTWSFTTTDPPLIAPTEGPGGPILVISTTTNPFSRYAVEILRAEGLNHFAAADISAVTAAVLNNYDVVVLGEMTVTAAQVTMFTNWVNAGGTLIAFKPSSLLNTLFGISASSGTLSDKYLLVNTASGPGVGIVNQTIQFHGTANLHTLSGATSLATLYSTATAATTNPAVTSRSVGTSGGVAVAFTYDLAKSIIYTRQGNPAWAGQKRDGQIDPIRSDDMFFPDWIDFNKIAIPQADEQQRLLANIILQSNLHRKPLPRFWYLPRDLKAAIVMTGDDHANNGTEGRFNQYLTLGPNTAQDIADWRAVRGTSYIYPGTPISNTQAVSFNNQGFEIALHPTTNCANFTQSSLTTAFTSQLASLASGLPGIPAPVTNRTHCLAWSDWSSTPKVELEKGIRFDVTYYYWPEAWMQNRPGMFTGSGMPMRFADLDGSLIDVYQATTQMTDETNMNYTTFCNAVLDKAVGAEGYYGVFTANMHTDNSSSAGSDAIIASAQARQIPVISSRQMLTWLDGRNNSFFSNMIWSNNQLTFSVTARSTANNLKAMLPLSSETGQLISITRNGNAVAFTTQTIKGIQYAFFAPVSGTSTYVATYSAGTRIANPVVTETTAISTPPATGTSKTKTEETATTTASKLYVNIMPNPSADNFNMIINSNDANPVTVRVSDIFGRLVETHEKVTSTGILRLGQSWRGGIYFAEVIQGDQRKVVKMIKTN